MLKSFQNRRVASARLALAHASCLVWMACIAYANYKKIDFYQLPGFVFQIAYAGTLFIVMWHWVAELSGDLVLNNEDVGVLYKEILIINHRVLSFVFYFPRAKMLDASILTQVYEYKNQGRLIKSKLDAFYLSVNFHQIISACVIMIGLILIIDPSSMRSINKAYHGSWIARAGIQIFYLLGLINSVLVLLVCAFHKIKK